MINGILPEDIRVNGYAEVQPYFDARFSCLYREYKYFFNLKDMNLEKMKLAAEKLIGLHDFRNFCQKYDEENFEEGEEQNFIRRIFSIKFLPVFGEGMSDHLKMYVCVIRGSAFLWHQIRFTMTALFMIGEGKDDENLIDFLLDVDRIPEKPPYPMASHKPLVLSNCYFEGLKFKDTLRGYADNFLNSENLVEQASIEFCVHNTVFEHFNKIFIPSSFIALPVNQHTMRDISLDPSEGFDLPKFASEYKTKKRVNKAMQKSSILEEILKLEDR